MRPCHIALPAHMYTTLTVDTATSVMTSSTYELSTLAIDKMKKLNRDLVNYKAITFIFSQILLDSLQL